MKKNKLFNFLIFILIPGISACSPQEDKTISAHKEVVQEVTSVREASPEITLREKEQERLASRIEENKKLFEIAKSGENKNMAYVRLAPENDFTDKVSENLTITRDGTSGPGTGKIIGNGLEFAEGACDDLNNLSDTDKRRIRWKKRINKCRSKILENDWCARVKDNPDESYTLTFLSWTISNHECEGACEEHDSKTAYIRVRTDNE